MAGEKNMKSESDVQNRLQELMKRRYRVFHQKYMEQCPRNCSFNTRFRIKGQGKVGFCQNPIVLEATGAKAFVCNDEEATKQCKVYRCRNDDESVKKEFDSILSSPERCGEVFPKLAILIWTIQDYKEKTRLSRFFKLFSIIGCSFFKLVTFWWW